MKLTKKEKAWVKKVNEVLQECPSERLGFFTIGDPELFIFDVSKLSKIGDIMDRKNSDFGPACVELKALASEKLFFTECVESTSG